MLLNSTQARKIFDKHSFLWGTQDVVDAVQMAKLFGKEAVFHVIDNYPEDENPVAALWLWEGHCRIAFTYDGFQAVIFYCNQKELIAREKMLLGKVPKVKDEEWHEVKADSKVISFEERRRQVQ